MNLTDKIDFYLKVRRWGKEALQRFDTEVATLTKEQAEQRLNDMIHRQSLMDECSLSDNEMHSLCLLSAWFRKETK